MSGAVLVLAAAVALTLANSPLAHAYHDFWHLPIAVGFGEYIFSQSLHF